MADVAKQLERAFRRAHMGDEKGETCDTIRWSGPNPGRCGLPAVARTTAPVSPLQADGRVRYCANCLKTAKAWGFSVEAWPKVTR